MWRNRVLVTDDCTIYIFSEQSCNKCICINLEDTLKQKSAQVINLHIDVIDWLQRCEQLEIKLNYLSKCFPIRVFNAVEHFYKFLFKCMS